MVRSIIEIAVVNIGLFIISISLYFFVGFSLGYGSNNNYAKAASILYGAFIITHLLINLLAVTKPRKNNIWLVIGSCVFVLLLHSIVVYIYR